MPSILNDLEWMRQAQRFQGGLGDNYTERNVRFQANISVCRPGGVIPTEAFSIPSKSFFGPKVNLFFIGRRYDIILVKNN